jgi:hypothetical protein
VSGVTNFGGLVGYNESTGTVNNSFWDTQTSSQPTSSGGTGKTTAEMNDFSTFFTAGWDLQCETRNGDLDIWGINESGTENNGYPFLSWQPFTNKVTLNLTTAVIGNGSTSGDGTFDCGNWSPILATANTCWIFDHWNGLNISDSINSSTTVLMNFDKTVTAVFVKRTYNLSYSAGVGGWINGSSSQGPVNCSESGTAVTAKNNYCYNFVRWSDGVTNALRTDTPNESTGDITVAASFIYACGGGGYIPPSPTININILGGSSTGTTDGNGVFQNAFDAASPDGKVAIHIAGGTQALGQDGKPLTQLTITSVSTYPTPPDGRTVIAAFDFQPNGAMFNPAIQITITYDPNTLPAGTDPSQLVIAFYNTATGQWQYVSGIVNPATHTITYSITHFTVFAVMGAATSSAAASTTPTATPTTAPATTPTITPTPTPAATPTVAATATPTSTVKPTTTPTATPTGIAKSSSGDNMPDNWVLAIIAAAGGILLAGLVGVIVKRNRKSS